MKVRIKLPPGITVDPARLSSAIRQAVLGPDPEKLWRVNDVPAIAQLEEAAYEDGMNGLLAVNHAVGARLGLPPVAVPQRLAKAFVEADHDLLKGLNRKKLEAAGQVTLAFDEGAHPRVPAGRANGGEFAPKGPRHEDTGAQPESAKIAPGDDWKANGVRSQPFKAWFGDWEHDPDHASQVVNAEGEPETTHPIPLYHGTSEEFHAFDTGRLGGNSHHPTANIGFFFTPSLPVAKKFAGYMVRMGKPKDLNEVASDLYGRPLFDLTDPDERHAVVEAHRRQADVLLEGESVRPHPRILSCYLNLRRPYRMPHAEWMARFIAPYFTQGPAASAAAVASFMGEMRADGHDGMIRERDPLSADNLSSEYSADAYVVFRPEQIKSVENEGNFSAETADIRKGATLVLRLERSGS